MRIFLFVVAVIFTCHLPLVSREFDTEIDPDLWVKQQLALMDLQEKVAQLFVVPAYAQETECLEKLEGLVVKEKVGGVIWMQGSPVRQVEWINHLQLVSKRPLLMAQDLEWGLAMRLKGTMKFPHHMTLGAIEDDLLVEEIAHEIGRQSRLVGIHLILAPVVDINSDPSNPVIHMRSFGEEKSDVARKGVAFLRGLHRAGVLGCAKHFPGHGDTRVDSHVALPTLPFNWRELEEREIYPFRELIREGVDTVMVGHLALPQVTGHEKLPATLSPVVIEQGLRGALGFRGAVITDGLNMKGVQSDLPPGQLELEAFKAGNDLLLMSENPSAAIRAIVAAVENGEISEARVDQSVARVLALKGRVGLHAKATVDPLRMRDLKRPEARTLRARAYSEAVTIAHDPHELLPIRGPALIVHLGANGKSPFATAMGLPWIGEERDSPLIAEAQTLLIALSDRKRAGEVAKWAAELEELGKRVVVVLFGSPYALDAFGDEESVVIAYEDEPDAQRAAAEVLSGRRPPLGRLPVLAQQGIE